MIPHKLTLRNFMCYRDDVPPLHFDGLNVVCLSGDNGAGKSTLLDAITWSLWGRARAKSDDDLIALGQSDMEVDFEFVLDGMLRRVIRRRTKGKRGQTLVDFQVCDADGAWRRISGDSVRDTDAQIAAALRMSYDTFINSAFLLQGRADEFTNRKPAERKQVLADILGLTEYERLETRAKERRSACDVEMRNLAGLIEEFERQISRRPFLEGEVQRAQVDAEHWDAELAGVEAIVQHHREDAEHLRRTADDHVKLEALIARDAGELDMLRQEVKHYEVRIIAADLVIARQTEIETGVHAFNALAERLDVFENLREEALRLNELRKDAQNRLDQACARLELEVATSLSEAKRLREHAADRDRLTVELRALEIDAQSFVKLRQELEQLQGQIAALDERARQIGSLQRERAQIEVRIRQYERVRDLQRAAEPLPRIEQRLTTITDLLRELGDLERRRTAFETQIRTATGERVRWEAERDRVKAEGAEVKKTLDALQAGELACPECDQPLMGNVRERMLTEYGSRREALRGTYRETLAAITRADQAIATAEKELATLADAMDERSSLMEEQAMLREQQRQAAAAARDLSLLGEDALGGEDLATELALKDEVIAKLGDLHVVEHELDSARGALIQLEHQLRRERQIDQQRASLGERLRASALAADQLPPVESRLAALEQQLANEAYAHEDRVARDEAQAGLDLIREQGYSSAAHNALKQEHSEHKHWLDEHRALCQARETRELDQSARERTAELVARRSADLEVAQQELLRMSGELQRRRSVEADLIAAEKSLLAARARQRSAQEELGRVKQELASCAQVEELLEGYRAQHAALAEQRGIYEDLVQAFGKKGIQAMLIETAIPDLEHESNTMLARMTDNQMHLSFETQRDSKKGDTIETLDIRIADGLGTRDYSMFSGGEAFRVNFAVRVALSKLLAHRADANLKTLVIDEGFGTQDSNGRDRIVEAINAVSPDFERILVITHIQELKDLFPAHIEVTKGPDGSAWRLI